MKRDKYQAEHCDTGPLYSRVYSNPEKSPERRLLEAVLLTFLFDAQRDYDEFLEMRNGRLERQKRILADHKITARTRHVEMLCGLVDLDHGAFVEKVSNIVDGLVRIEIKSIHT